jgi:2-C-methyl-D-erythritol 2,4-cyclodiphosphate synthase
MIRIGHGYDAHRFAEAYDYSVNIMIGGVKIPHSHELLAHSDGDVLIHALCDAILGALALGDIGHHFPDTEDEYEDIDSRILLRRVMQEVELAHCKIANADMTIIAQMPKMAPHIETMCIRLADDLKVDRSQVNVKATTTEKMGFIGRKEGIAAHAVVLLNSIA